MAAAASVGTRDGLVGMLGVLDQLETDRTGLSATDRLECVRLARRLADRTATLAAVLVAEADTTGASEQVTGAAMTSWLAVEAGASKREAAGALKQGRALAAHPVVSGAAISGGIGAGQARSITRVLDGLGPQLDETQQRAAEQLMVGLAKQLDADGLAQAAAHVLATVAPSTADELVEQKLQREAEQASRERSLRFFEVGGSIRFDGSLPKLVGRVWMGLIDTYVHATRRTMLEERDRLAEPLTFEQRRADALTLLIQQHQHLTGSSATTRARRDRPATVSSIDRRGRAGVSGRELPGSSGDPAFGREPTDNSSDCAGVPGRGSSGDAWDRPGVSDREPPSDSDDRAGVPGRQLVGWSRSAADLYGARGSPMADRARIFIVIDHDKLVAQAAGAGLLNGVEPLSAGDLRRLCCDAGILPAVMGGDSVLLDLGQERRLVTPDLRAALELRDRGCVMPGCDIGPVGCEAHHIIPWASGGPTALHNLVLLCVQHHPKFEPAKHRLKQPWQVQIGSDGIPEVIPPPFARLGDTPIRHQRFARPPARAG